MLDSALKCDFSTERCDSASLVSSAMASLPSMDINHLLTAVDQDLQQQQPQNDNNNKHETGSSNSSTDNNPERHLNVVLEDRELWEKFKEFTNEMIVTKNGREETSFLNLIFVDISIMVIIPRCELSNTETNRRSI